MTPSGEVRLEPTSRVRAGTSQRSPLATVLFVCLHNAGRSQMSAALFDQAAGGRHCALSAGTLADPDGGVHPEVIEVMREIGIDLSDRRPQKLTHEIAQQADVVVTMGCGDACPYIPGKRYIDWELGDPNGRPIDEVRATREEIAQRVNALVSELDTMTPSSQDTQGAMSDPEEREAGHMTSDADRPVIVAGVDGSQGSLEALRWAARQAEMTGAELHAVMAWSLPEIYSYTPRDFQGDARKALENAIEQALGKQPRVTVIARVVEGHPARALIDASRDAQLLVVGSRGHGAFTGMLLGSVSQHCVGHAECPVVVVRHRQP